MPQKLFRQEVLEEQGNRLNGEVILVTSITSRMLTIIFIGFIVATIYFLKSNSYVRKETVSGWLSPDTGFVKIVASSGGILSELHVAEHDIVRAGDPIATLRLSYATEEGDFGSTIETVLKQQAFATSQESIANAEKLALEQQRLLQSRNGSKRELQTTLNELKLLEERSDLSRVELDRAEAAASEGLITIDQVESRKFRLVDSQIAVAGMERTATQIQNSINDMNAQLGIYHKQKAQAQARSLIDNAALAERTARSSISNTYVITSPIDGRIDLLSASLGQFLTPSRSIGIVSPEGSRLYAELFVPSKAAGFIKNGQSVRLKYQAFPHKRFGTGKGVLSNISHTVLSPDEVSLPGAIITEPVFRVLAEIKSDKIKAYGDDIPLRAGMLLSADIEVDRRTLLQWLLDPLFAAGRIS